MSAQARNTPAVERSYEPDPEACARAIEIVLQGPASKAAGEDGGEERTRRRKNVARNRIIPNTS